MNIDELRKNYRSKSKPSIKNSFEVNNSKGAASELNEMKVRDMSDSKDISIAFINNGYFYFCFGWNGQKIKIPMSSLIDKNKNSIDIQQLLEKIDCLSLPILKNKAKDCEIYEFCQSMPQLLKSAEKLFIIFSNELESYLNALKIQRLYPNVTKSRVLAESHIASLAAVALEASGVDEKLVEYHNGNKVVEIEIGDGVIEIKGFHVSSVYKCPLMADIIKGTILQYGILEGLIKDILLLDTVPYEIGIIFYENGKAPLKQIVVPQDTTIPIRLTVDYTIKSTQKIVIVVEEKIVTSDISQFFESITGFECWANHEIYIKGIKNEVDVVIPLSKLMYLCPPSEKI